MFKTGICCCCCCCCGVWWWWVCWVGPEELVEGKRRSVVVRCRKPLLVVVAMSYIRDRLHVRVCCAVHLCLPVIVFLDSEGLRGQCGTDRSPGSPGKVHWKKIRSAVKLESQVLGAPILLLL